MLKDIITLWLALDISRLLKSQNIEARTPRPTGKMEQAAVITLVKPESHADRRKVKLTGGARRTTLAPCEALETGGSPACGCPSLCSQKKAETPSGPWFLAADRRSSCAGAEIDVSFHLLQGQRPWQARASSEQLAFDVMEISSGFQDHLSQAVLQPQLSPRDPSFPTTSFLQPHCVIATGQTVAEAFIGIDNNIP